MHAKLYTLYSCQIAHLRLILVYNIYLLYTQVFERLMNKKRQSVVKSSLKCVNDYTHNVDTSNSLLPEVGLAYRLR